MFGVPDYSDIRSVPEGTWYLSGHRKGVSGTPGKDMGLMGHRGNIPAPGAPLLWTAGPKGRKGGRARPSFLSLSWEKGKEGATLPYLSPAPI